MMLIPNAFGFIILTLTLSMPITALLSGSRRWHRAGRHAYRALIVGMILAAALSVLILRQF